MPPLIGLVLLGVGVVAGYRAIQIVAGHMRTEFGSATEEARQGTAATAQDEPIKDLGALEFDPHSGVYKPKNG